MTILITGVKAGDWQYIIGVHLNAWTVAFTLNG